MPELRLIKTGLALGPVLLAAALPIPEIAVGPVFGVGAACSLVALVGALGAPAEGSRRQGRGGVMLRRTALRAPPADLPDLPGRRRAVATALHPEPRPGPDHAPADPAEMVADILCRIARAGGNTAPGRLRPDQVTELYLLARLLRAAPDEAGQLAQLFRRPATVLALHEAVGRQARARSAFDRQRRAFDATAALWRKTPPPAPRRSLASAVKALGAPDPDLWHRIVAEHDRSDPDHREAALWCASQPACNRATVALFIVRIAEEGVLQTAARHGDMRYLDDVRAVIVAWNAGFYTVAELALDPPEAIAGKAGVVSRALDDVARLTLAQRWPDPAGAFAAHPGRPARPRVHWCLRTGLLTAPPDPADYALAAA